MSPASPARPWFALHIRMRERNIETALQHKEFEIFSPYYTRKKIGARGRERELRLPLFPGYLFCALDPQDRLDVLTVPGVKAILGLGRTVTPIPPEEIEAIRKALSSGLPYEPCRVLEPGDSVIVQNGPLAGVEGLVFRYKGKDRLVLKISALNNRAVSVEVDGYMVARKPPGVEQGNQARYDQLRLAKVAAVPGGRPSSQPPGKL